MKILFKIFILFCLIISSVQADSFNVLVLPVDIFETKQNYYGFEEVSEIIANDIIKNFNNSNGRIKSPDIYEVRSKFAKDTKAVDIVRNSLLNYKLNGKIDYEVFKVVADNFDCKYLLLVKSSAVTNKNSVKRGIWEVLEISTAFNTNYPYRMETSLTLLDNVNNSVMWSNNFSSKLGTNENAFSAKNYSQAYAQYEKIKLYSQTVPAPSASQNIMLRFFPKTIKPIETEVENSKGAIRYDRVIPEKPKIRDSVPYTGDLLYEF